MNNNRKRKKRRVDTFLGKLFIICMLLIIIGNLLIPNKEKSEQENRMLAQRPKLTVSSLISGNFMEQYENYQTDQFIGRNTWIKLKVALNRFGGSKVENGVFIGRKSQLLEDIAVPDSDTLSRKLEAIKGFKKTYADIPVTFLLAPDAATVLQDSLPTFATVSDQSASISLVKKELGEAVQWVDAVKVLSKHTDEKIYYKTDHHWTTQGAFYVWEEAAVKMGITNDLSSIYASYPVTTEYNGVLSSKTGSKSNVKEQIDIYVPKDADNDMIVNYVDQQKKTTSLYDSSKLKGNDKYEVFLGGNTSVIDIKTVAENKKRILVVKDSFANSFVPFLTPFYREIVMVDPRYYTGNIKDIMETYEITDVLFLYSGNTFFQDNNLSGVLTGE